jgi:hypothetical protein
LSRLKTTLIPLSFLRVVIVAAPHTITSSEAIPDSAKFVYDRNLRIVVPCAELGTRHTITRTDGGRRVFIAWGLASWTYWAIQ